MSVSNKISDLDMAVREALHVVARNAHLVVRKGRLTFEQLSDVLLEVAKAIAKINEVRIRNSCKSVGENELLTVEKRMADDIEAVWQFGIVLAHEMIRFLSLLDRKEGTCVFQVFLSHAGEEKFLYIPILAQELEKVSIVFVDSRDLQAGQTTHAPKKMFRSVLAARVVLSVASIDAIQKEWPVAELLCGLARNQHASDSGDASPLVVDATAGASHGLRFKSWFKTLHQLVPKGVFHLSCVECKPSTNGIDHIQEVVNAVKRSLDGNQLRSPDVLIPNAEYNDTDEAKSFSFLFDENRPITESDIKELLLEEEHGSFSVRPSRRHLDQKLLSGTRKQRLAALTTIDDHKQPRSCLYYFNSMDNRYFIVQKDSTTEKLKEWKKCVSLDELLFDQCAFSFVRHKNHHWDVNDFFVAAAQKAVKKLQDTPVDE